MSLPQTSDPLRRLALLAPHGRSSAGLPNDFPVNKTAAYRRITPAMTGEDWRLTVTGPDGAEQVLTHADLLGLPQHTYQLPIACVEGWSTSQRWTGPRVRDLAALVGVAAPASVRAVSLQRGGGFREATLTAQQSRDDRSLLALRRQRRDPGPRPRVPGPDDRPERARGALHQVGHPARGAGVSTAGLRRWYGAGPLHLAATALALATAGAVAAKVAGLSTLPGLVLWFVGAAVLHDAVLFPLYAVLDRSLVAGLRRRRDRDPAGRLPVPLVNHVRVPLAFSLLLLGLFFPLVLRTQAQTYQGALGLSVDVYRTRYLALVAAMFGVSLAVWAVRVARARR